ncbi:MAG: anti-sigma-I factor RsgI family protein [Bacillota bacterium]
MDRKTQAMVIKVEKKTLVVITGDGEYRRLVKPAIPVRMGQTISMADLPSSRNWVRPLIAGLLLVILAAGIIKPFAMPAAVASVSLDMTPRVELAVSKEGKVLKAKAANPEGEIILQQVQVKGLHVYQAVGLITQKAISLNYLCRENKNIVFAAVVAKQKEEKIGLDQAELMRIMHDQMAWRSIQGYIVVNQVARGELDQALAAGLPVNRYLLWEKSRAAGMEISRDMLRSVSMDRVAAQIAGNLEQVLPGSWCSVKKQERQQQDMFLPVRPTLPVSTQRLSQPGRLIRGCPVDFRR